MNGNKRTFPINTDNISNTDKFLEQTLEFQKLMVMYNCAIKEIKTKLEVLNDDLSIRNKRNPIEFISTRVKNPVSIVNKLTKNNVVPRVENINDNLNDVAGVRVICSFIDDIYQIAGMLLVQDDIKLLEKKDYIQNPKPNGYRSLHLIVELPVFFSDHKQDVKVEIQIRTIAMDFWASLEHQIHYKQSITDSEEIIKELKECADVISETDVKMQGIRDKIAAQYRDDDNFYDQVSKINFFRN